MRARNARLLLALILALAGALRVAGLEWGLPDARHHLSYGGDEGRAVAMALALGSAESGLVPTWRGEPFFRWGHQHIYALGACFALARAVGLLDAPAASELPELGDWAAAHWIARAERLPRAGGGAARARARRALIPVRVPRSRGDPLRKRVQPDERHAATSRREGGAARGSSRDPRRLAARRRDPGARLRRSRLANGSGRSRQERTGVRMMRGGRQASDLRPHWPGARRMRPRSPTVAESSRQS